MALQENVKDKLDGQSNHQKNTENNLKKGFLRKAQLGYKMDKSHNMTQQLLLVME